MSRNLFLIFIFAVIAGFLIFKLLGAQKSGEQPKIGFNIVLYRGNNQCDHIHHWITFTFLSVFGASMIYLSKGEFSCKPIVFLFGFAVGASLEDLTYKDWYAIEQPCRRHQINSI